ncbi:MAG: DUF1080 domain-containing protein [Nitrospirae bacterium]|nr:MAG: DUF1080 domain-containing protein [Nitrospirota bacterium]
MRMCAVVLMALAWGNPAWADFRIQAWSFDKDAPGKQPAGFAAAGANGSSGRWEVAVDAHSSSPPHVLARISSGSSGRGAQVIFIENTEAANLDITVRVKVIAAGEGQGGGIVFRAADDRNYYVAWFSPQEKTVRLDRVVNGEVKPLQDLKIENADIGKWYTLRLNAVGPVYEAFFNNQQFLSARDDAWEFGRYAKGKVGLWAQGSGTVYFDNVRFTAMDGGTGSAPLGGTDSTIITK